ncbi:MAG: hypothetical protein ABI114_17860 [Rhodanobacter sp.]
MNTPDNATTHGTHLALSDQALVKRARELYRNAAQQLDPATAGRLRAARRQALEAAQAPARHSHRWLVPSGAFAVIALAALMIWQPLPHNAAAPSANATYNGSELDAELPPDADKTDPNLYQDLDFYSWLAANNSTPTSH